MKTTLLTLLVLGLLCQAWGHGRLVVPTTRDIFNGVAEFRMNEPTGHDVDFVCRQHGPMSPQTTIRAGSPLTVQWSFSAAHVGDCFFYLSYDTNEPDLEMEWFKIAQIADCRSYNNQDFTIMIPDYIPSSEHAVLRFEWYALQQVTNIEFYAQCVDVVVEGVADGVLGTPRVTVPDHLPADNQNLENYRLAFNPNSPFFFTGPAVAVADDGVTPTPSPDDPVDDPEATEAPTTEAPTTQAPTTEAPTYSNDDGQDQDEDGVTMTGTVRSDGRCGANWDDFDYAPCRSGFCCSSSGFCGIGDAWCVGGVQFVEVESTTAECGCGGATTTAVLATLGSVGFTAGAFAFCASRRRQSKGFNKMVDTV